MKIPFSKASLGKEEEQAVLEVMRSGWLAAGEKTTEFEEKFAKYISVKYAIFTNSGTAALKMAYKYMKEEVRIKEVLIPRNTFCATYSAAEEVGLKVWMTGMNDSGGNVAVWYGGTKTERKKIYLEDSGPYGMG